jgi:tRNA G10  N-methylase Trm11
MPNYYFQLGSTPELSWQELQTVLSNIELERVSVDLVKANLADDQTAQQYIQILGGTIKILKELAVAESLTKAQITQKFADIILANKPNTFAIAEWGRDHLPKIEATEIKSLVRAAGFNPSYKDQTRHGLSAALLLHHPDIFEIIVIQIPQGLIFAQTLSVQNIDEWSTRDRGKPYFDRKKGMLPPKVARMMVNLALGDTVLNQDLADQQVIYDPFCGSGTILLESLMLGRSVIGSDLDPDSVNGTQQNVDWLKNEYQLPESLTFQGLVQDATHVSNKSLTKPVTHIVTEPFLGKPTPQEAEVANIFKGLEKLYLGVFKQWQTILADQAEVVIVLPLVETSRHTFNLEGLIDKLANLGYTTVFQPIIYKRPQAIVQRQIIKFKYQR